MSARLRRKQALVIVGGERNQQTKGETEDGDNSANSET
jgi:hypothetical protein